METAASLLKSSNHKVRQSLMELLNVAFYQSMMHACDFILVIRVKYDSLLPFGSLMEVISGLLE